MKQNSLLALRIDRHVQADSLQAADDLVACRQRARFAFTRYLDSSTTRSHPPADRCIHSNGLVLRAMR